jgi:nicotinamide phosphoribosyltransferase
MSNSTLSRAQISKILSPKASDRKYTVKDLLIISMICRADSYKFGHAFAYPKNTRGMSSYGTARVDPSVRIIPFGMQLLMKKYFTQRITMEHIDQAEKFALAHFGRPLFSRAAWEKVVNVYDGKLPLIIRAVPEGFPVRGQDPLYTVTCLDEDLFWMASYFETVILRGIWYPTTIATMDRSIKQEILHYYEITGADMGLLPFSLHDFGGRGVTCAEQAEIGGAAHTVNFMGSDTVEGVLTANFYYNEEMSAYSVFATEHSIECSFGGGEEDAKAYIRSVLANALPGTIVSIVIDGYDVYREAELLCTEFRQQIIDSKAKVVFRPDSGDMMEVVPRILRMQEVAFGTTLTAKGHKKINHVGIIQGDGVDHLSIVSLLGKVVNVLGYAADVVIFGSGGSLLQKVNRDTYKFAQKAASVLVIEDDGTEYWKGIAKNPITDPGKKSLEGILTLVRSKMTGQLGIARLDQELNEEFEDMHQLVYYYGDLYNEVALSEVRANCN